ncbi:MAG: hypothetical protein QW203_05125 [Thermoplasmatales archaeon]
MATITSNKVTVTVGGVSVTYGLACSSAGYWICARGYGPLSIFECENKYKDIIGKPCR